MSDKTDNSGERAGVVLPSLDSELFGGAEATKRDLIDYLDAVRDQIIGQLGPCVPAQRGDVCKAREKIRLREGRLDALVSNTQSSDNTAIGAYSLQNNTGGNWNTAIGSESLSSNTNGANNTAAAWEKLTDQIGREKQIALYKASLGI